jgi:hypothetical protein
LVLRGAVALVRDRSCFFRNLALLDAVRPRLRYRLALARYAADAWQHGWVAATGLFNGFGPATLL